MGPPRERYKVTKKQKTGVRLKRGSKKYLHLQKFIERRREKKIEKRRTLDPTAKVIFVVFLIYDDNDDDFGDVVVDREYRVI